MCVFWEVEFDAAMFVGQGVWWEFELKDTVLTDKQEKKKHFNPLFIVVGVGINNQCSGQANA